MADTKVGHIVLTEYVYGGPGEGSDAEALRGTQTIGIPTDDALFHSVSTQDFRYDDGVRAKVTYRNDPTAKTIYTNETVAMLVSQSNGNASAS
jgi:hypothetical protein